MSSAQISFPVPLAQRLHPFSLPTFLPSLYIPPSGDECFFTAANVDVNTIVEPSAQDRAEIESLVDRAQDRVINGKTIPKPVKNAETPSHPDFLKFWTNSRTYSPIISLWAFQFLAKPVIPLIWWGGTCKTTRASGLPLILCRRDRAQTAAGGVSPGWPD